MTEQELGLCARVARGTGPLTPDLAAVARQHRMHLLLADTLSEEERRTPDGVSLSRELTVAAALNAWRDEVLRALLEALAEGGVRVLLLKGTGLAYTVYQEPHLRPRADVDVLIERDMLVQTEKVLASHAWLRLPERDSDLSEPQRHYSKHAAGVLHRLDLHWKIANPRRFADALTFNDLESRAIAVTPLGDCARTLSFTDALLVACIHRVAHHGDAIDLLWLWDIHLLMGHLSAGDREGFIALAERTGMRAVCGRGLRLAGELFGTCGALPAAARLEEVHRGSKEEPSSRFLGGVHPITLLRSDLTTLPWLDRLHLIGDHLFPSTVYMRARYPRWSPILLPLAYLDRIARGLPKWFKR